MSYQNETHQVDYLKHDLAVKFYFRTCPADINTVKSLSCLYRALFNIWNEKGKVLSPFKIFRDNVMLEAFMGNTQIYAKYMCRLHEMGLIIYSNYKNEEGKISRVGTLCTVQMRPLDKIYEKWWQEVKLAEKAEKTPPPFPIQFEPFDGNPKNTTSKPQKTENETTYKKPQEKVPSEADLKIMAEQKNKQLILFYGSEIMDRLNAERTKMGIETPIIVNDIEKKACEELLNIAAKDTDINVPEKMEVCIKEAIATWVENAVGNKFWIQKFFPSGIKNNIQHFGTKMKKQDGAIVNDKGIPIANSKGNRFPRDIDELQQLYKEKYQKNTATNKDDKQLILRFMKEEIGFYFDEKLKRLMRPKANTTTQ